MKPRLADHTVVVYMTAEGTTVLKNKNEALPT